MLMGNHEPVIAAKCCSEGKEPSIKHTLLDLTFYYTHSNYFTRYDDTPLTPPHKTTRQVHQTRRDFYTLCLLCIHTQIHLHNCTISLFEFSLKTFEIFAWHPLNYTYNQLKCTHLWPFSVVAEEFDVKSGEIEWSEHLAHRVSMWLFSYTQNLLV